MNCPYIDITQAESDIRIYYTHDDPPVTIDGCIIAWYRVIYINAIPQMIIALKVGSDNVALDSVLITLVSQLPVAATYIGIKDGKPC